MEKLREIIEKQRKGHEREPIYMIGEQLLDIARREPRAEEIIAQDLQVGAMSLTAAAKKLKEYADKHRGKETCFCITPDVAEGILREFYGLGSAEPVQPELSAEREAEIRAEVSAEYQRKLEAAADVHVQKLQFAINEWIEIFNRKIVPEFAEIGEDKRGKIAEVVKTQAKLMAERLEK